MAAHLNPSDDEMLGEFDKGDSTALGRLLERYRLRLVSFVRKTLCGGLASKADPEDIVQEVFLEVHERAAEYVRNPAIPFRPWLLRIARDHCLTFMRSYLRTKKRDITKERPIGFPADDSSAAALADQLIANSTSPSSRVSRKELIALVQSAVQNLSAKHREIIDLRHEQELTNQEAAAYLGIGEPAAAMRYARALQKLNEELGGLLETAR